MKLYVNGCSFTHGHLPVDHPERIVDPTKPDQPYDWVWASRLKSHFDEVVNEAWRGCGNDRIVRRTINYLSKVPDPQNWTVIIQWTSIEREEWFDNDLGVWFNQVPHRVIYDDHAWQKVDLENKDRIDARGKTFEPFFALGMTDEHRLINLCKNIMVLEYFFQQKGFGNVFYTGMSLNCMLPYHFEILEESIRRNHMIDDQYISKDSPNKHILEVLYRSVSPGRFLQPISAVSRNNTLSKEDAHPNSEGHRLFYEYILYELERRNIL